MELVCRKLVGKDPDIWFGSMTADSQRDLGTRSSHGLGNTLHFLDDISFFLIKKAFFHDWSQLLVFSHNDNHVAK